MNYKKSILSLVAVMALSNTVSADSGATYMPLTTVDNDSSWVLFGVNGFSNGVPTLATVVSDFSAGYIELEDLPVDDDAATSGLNVTGGDLASVQAIADAANPLSGLRIAVDTTGKTFEATEPVRTMYIKVGNDEVRVKFDYKATLEGERMELIIDNSSSARYEVTISQHATFSNPATAIIDTGASAAGSVPDRVAITEILDYNFTNPVNPVSFDKDVHLQTKSDLSAKEASIYHFDSISQQWKVWNQNNTAANANDFTDLSAGDGYWGRVDINQNVGALVNDDGGATGLVLGESSATIVPDATVYDGKLTTGWNMLAFDKVQPYVRHAATGLIADLNGTATVRNIRLVDDTGVNTLDVNITANGAAGARQINTAIEAALLLGTVPKTFTIKAFATNDSNVTFISDKKFSLADPYDLSIGGVKTLTNQNPYTAGTRTTARTDLNDTLATSAYGEYTMMIDLLTTDLATSTTTAASLDFNATGTTDVTSAKILFGAVGGSEQNAMALSATTTNTNPSFATAKAQILTQPMFETGTSTDGIGDVTAVDTDFDGSVDKVILASTVPFYIKDNTFTRVFTKDTSSANGVKTFTVKGTNEVAIAPALNDTASDIATLINAQADATALTGVYAAASADDTKVIAVSSDKSNFDLVDVASVTDDFLTKASLTNEEIAKGAIGGAYALDTVAKKSLILNSFETSGFVLPTATTDELNVSVNGDANSTYAPTAAFIAATTDTAQRKAYFDGFVALINTKIPTGTHGYAIHTYTEEADTFSDTKVILSGVNITEHNITTVDAIVPATATTNTNAGLAGTIESLTGTPLASDVTFNAIYTPNYANFGPLYTMFDAGYSVRALLKATTEMNSSAITWDSIDLTRDEQDWFANNEFNLFSINHNSGYWAYLENTGASTVTIGEITATPTYTYYFENDASKTTRNVVNGGILSVEIDGLGSTTTSTAYATIKGVEVQLKSTGGTTYTANLNHYDISGFGETAAPIDISIRATNGKGEAVETTDLQTLKFDYAKTVAPTISAPNASSVIISSADVNDTAKIYVFKDNISEDSTLRDTALTNSGSTITPVAGSGTLNMCPNYTFGNTDTFRAVSADNAHNSDGALGLANLSDQLEFTYTTALKGAHVLTHLFGNTKSQEGTLYSSTCASTGVATENDGVSLKTLASGATYRMAFEPIDNVNFTTNLAWTAHYKLDTGSAVIQVQNVEAYANKKFIIDNGTELWEGTFPANQTDADLSIASPKTLTKTSSINQTLAP